MDVRDCMLLSQGTDGDGSVDSYTALSVMTSLKKLAKQKNLTVICTIHQPSAEIFDLFENLMLLANGRVVYFGSASEV